MSRRRDDEPPSLFDTEPEIAGFVQGHVEARLRAHALWPANLLKLELETAQVFQDFSGPVLDELESMDQLKFVTHGKHSYVQRTTPAPADEEVRAITQKTEAWQKFLATDFCGSHFGELVNYVALARAVVELQEAGIKTLSILPQGSYPWQLRDAGQIDIFLQLHGENFPLDVYNGTHFLRDEDDKPARARALFEKGFAHPCLANRLAHQATKFDYARMNGLVLDHGKIFALRSEATTEWIELTKFFNLHKALEWLPPISVGGEPLDGKSYWEVSRKQKNGLPVVDDRAFAAAADQLPAHVVERARGFVRLLYVNSEYRLARDNKELRAVAIAMQRSYHKLLRSDDGMPLDEFVDYGWRAFLSSYRKVASLYSKEEARYKQLLHERARELHARKILRIHGTRVSVPDTRHPHVDLAFQRSRPREVLDEDDLEEF